MKRYRFKRIIVTEMWADIFEETAEEAFETVNRKYEADNDDGDFDYNTISETEFMLEEIEED
nr:MAG TPA: hypothetical protein [Caudoviricetes sp.]